MLTQSEVAGKPRLSYAEFVAQQKVKQFTDGTVAWVLDRYYEKFKDSIGLSQMYTMRNLQRSPHIGPKNALELSKQNIWQHAEMRLLEVKPQTVNQDFTYLRVALNYAGSAWDDCAGISDKAIREALPFMKKAGMVRKSEPRDRLPMEDEIAKLRSFYREQAKHKNTKQPMELLMDWQLASGRRIGETCGLIWRDWDFEKQIIFVRKMKKQKNGKTVALTDEAQSMLLEIAYSMDADSAKRDSEERIFPYNAKSVGASYTRAKAKLGIPNLRLHDSRAKCYTTLREKGVPGSIAILVTGHQGEALPERVYKRSKAEDFKTLQHVREGARA